MDWMRLVSRLPPPRPRRISMDEVKLHNRPSDAWVVLSGNRVLSSIIIITHHFVSTY
jgi:hypothetical protein